MDDDTTTRPKWKNSYSGISVLEAEKRLGFMMQTLDNEAIPVSEMLADAGYTIDESNEEIKIKSEVYKAILQYLDLEGYPTETNPDYTEYNVSDLVLYILGPIVSYFKCKHIQKGQNIRLRREKEIVSVDGETGGKEKFVMIDRVSVTERYFVLVIEAKRSSLGEAMKQCLLSMRDMQDGNGVGKVYGFITTGESWQMVRYDGVSF